MQRVRFVLSDDSQNKQSIGYVNIILTENYDLRVFVIEQLKHACRRHL